MPPWVNGGEPGEIGQFVLHRPGWRRGQRHHQRRELALWSGLPGRERSGYLLGAGDVEAGRQNVLGQRGVLEQKIYALLHWEDKRAPAGHGGLCAGGDERPGML